LFFFFDAEDCIRRSLVTGVQTCALPIYVPDRLPEPDLRDRLDRARAGARERHDTAGPRLRLSFRGPARARPGGRLRAAPAVPRGRGASGAGLDLAPCVPYRAAAARTVVGGFLSAARRVDLC